MNVHNDSARDAPVAPALYTLAHSSNLKDSMNNEQLSDSHTQHDDHSPHLDEVGAPKPITGSDSMSAWEKRYASTQRLWSEDVNELLPEFAAPLAPGRALDIGCGEGTDLLYLLERGWQVVGVDFSATAISRFLEGARQIGAADRATGLVGDARALHIEGLFDLVYTPASLASAQDDVERKRFVFDRTMILVDECGMVMPVLHTPLIIPRASPLAIDKHVANGGRQQKAERVEQRTLATAARTCEQGDASRLTTEVPLLEDVASCESNREI